MTSWQIAWDLVQIAVGVLMTYGVAIWKGDAVMRRLNERKRLGAWSRLREQIIGHIRATTGPLFASAQLRGRIDRTQGFNPDKWVTHLREILSRAQTRTNDGIVEDADLWNRELDPEAILGATDVGLEYAGRVSRQLGTVRLLYETRCLNALNNYWPRPYSHRSLREAPFDRWVCPNIRTISAGTTSRQRPTPVAWSEWLKHCSPCFAICRQRASRCPPRHGY